MKLLIGGTVALIIGFLGLAFWWSEFFRVLKGVVPIIFVLGGGPGHLPGNRRSQDHNRFPAWGGEERIAFPPVILKNETLSILQERKDYFDLNLLLQSL